MAAQFSVSNGDTTATFSYTTATATMQSIAGDAAHYLFDKGYYTQADPESPVDFDTLTNQEKLDLIDAHLKRAIKDLANTYKSVAAQDAARATEAANEYTL